MRAETTTVGDKYSQALAEALARSNLTNPQIAEHIGINHPNLISQWKYGWKPMPAVYAPKMAALLGARAETISAAYEKLFEEGILPTPGADATVPAGHVCVDRLHGFCRENGPASVVLPDFVVDMKIGKTPSAHVRWVFQPTSAMAPMILQGSLVLIDSTQVSHGDVVDGGLYAYELYGRPYVRRILIGRDSWSLCGFDAGVERVVIKTSDLDDIKLRGTVLGWL